MAPKGKAKAKAKGKGKDAGGDLPMLDVPPPPPEPTCIALPENLVDKYANERCLLMTWSDPKGEYKLQFRPFTPGEDIDRKGSDDQWVDARDKERVNLSNRSSYHVWLVQTEYVRLQYRLISEKGAMPIDGLYVANWASPPSEPVATYVDPPVEVAGELCFDSDVMPPSVNLRWTSSNIDLMKKVMGEGPAMNEHGPFASWPGIMPVKVQVRWRVVRTLSGMDSLPTMLTHGRHFVSQAIENIRKESFDFRSEVWKMSYREIIHGVVARFSVRVGTSYRWSPWSEESDDVEVEIPEPVPLGFCRSPRHMDSDGGADADAECFVTCVELGKLVDREADLSWPQFMAAPGLNAIEYRVALCRLDGPGDTPAWDKGVVLTTLLPPKGSSDTISYKVQRLHPNTFYAVRVDARYPYIGKRSFSNAKAVSAVFCTPFPQRPPLQPLPAVAADVPLDDEKAMTEVAPAAAAVEEEEGESFVWADTPWIALRVERMYLNDYDIEFKAALAGGKEIGSEYFQSWQAPLKTLRVDKTNTAGDKASSRSGEQSDAGRWCIVRVAFPRNSPEVVVCRLIHRKGLKSVSPLQWSCTTPPLVPYIAPVSFSGPISWARVSDEGVNLALRFFLHPGATNIDEHISHLTCAAPERHKSERKLGHRFISRYQLRFRAESDAASSKGWITLEPRLLPPAKKNYGIPGSKCSDSIPGSAENICACLGWFGARFEVDVDPSAKGLKAILADGASFEVQVRVGNDHRWSPWASPCDTGLDGSPEAHLDLVVPAPSPMPNAQLECSAKTSTRLWLSWFPFERLPGVTRVEYIVRALPLFGEAEEAAGPEGAEAVERRFFMEHSARLTYDELLQSTPARRLLDDATEVPMHKLLQVISNEQDKERDEDRKQGRRIEVELAGLLPCTRYDVSVSARYLAAASLPCADDGSTLSLSAVVETPGGEAPPAAPRPAKVPEDSAISPEARAVLLEIENRPGYVLEYRAAGPASAYFEPRESQKNKTGAEFGGSWQDGAGTWRRVLSTKSADGSEEVGSIENHGAAESCIKVWAELPFFSTRHSTGPDKVSLPDAVEFRLCTAARSAAHPCRWAGGISSPVAVCFAPPRRAPKVRRVLSDERWCLSLTIELFKTAPAPVGKLLGTTDEDDDDDLEHEDEDDREFIELRKSHVVPVPPKETWSSSAVGRLPVGYGHKMASVLQFRHSLQSAMTPVLRKQLEEKTLSKSWQSSMPVAINQESLSGDRCTVEVGSDAGLLDGGIYMFQVRIGDGCRWSTWSHISNAFVFRVPPPAPPSAAAIGTQQAVTVEVVSSTVARVRWCDFRPAPGLTLLEYEVRATPQQLSQSRHGCMAVSASYEHKYRGGWIEREVSNLLPFTPYVFSVQARYPKVGGRAWTGSQASEPVTLEHPTAAQDPPTPFAVVDPEDREVEEEAHVTLSSPERVPGRTVDSEHSGTLGRQDTSGAPAIDGGQRTVLLAFPDEEGGTQYDLEYAHVLGDDQDTSEIRVSQTMWHSPVEVDLVDNGSHGMEDLPRWRIQMPDLRAFRAEPLKLALLQRVRFRLRARFTSETPTTRWWSSLSAPIATGFAQPDGAAAALIAAGDRLAVEVQFSLDRRLADAVAAAGVGPMRTQRQELDKQLQEDEAKVQNLSMLAAEAGPAPATGQALWPRGFGHPFVRRYQLRVRYQKKKDGEGASAGAADGAGGDAVEWGPWEVLPEASLPKEVDRGVMGAGWFAGSAGNLRAANPQARWYSVEVPQMRGRAYAPGDVVQTAVRVGDGVKWSAWKGTKEVAISVPPPRPAREGDMAKAEWIGSLCTVTWPAAAGPIGLDTIEYQLMVEPDSNALPSRIGAVIIMPAATSRRDEGIDSSGKLDGAAPSPPKRWGMQRGTLLTTGEDRQANHRASDLGQLGGLQLSPSSSRRANRSSVLSGLPDDRPAHRAEQLVLVELGDLCTDLRYGFTVLARYPTVGPRTWSKIFEVAKVSWRASPFVSAVSQMGRAGELRVPPMPEQVSAPEDGRLKRWQDTRFVLLTWPGLEVVDEARTPASMHLELQASEVPKLQKDAASVRAAMDVGQSGDTAGGAGDAEAVEEASGEAVGGRAWRPCSDTIAMTLDGAPCLAVRDLPFLVQQFRLFDTNQQRAGPVSRPCVTIYEAVSPAPPAELQALGKGAPRTLGIRLKVSLAAPGGTQRRATRYQVRFRALVLGGEWEELEPSSLVPEKDEVSILVREEDGLELGPPYEFSVRVGDTCRLGPWSEPTRPLKFAVPGPEPPENGGVKVVVEAEQAVLSWPPFQPEASLKLRMPGFAKLPIEYTVSVYGGSQDDPVATFVTRETQATVRSLAPATAYSAVLSACWSRFGAIGAEESLRRPGVNKPESKTSLMAAFATAQSSKRLIAELSVRVPSNKVGGLPGTAPAVASFPIDDLEPRAVTLDLDPYYSHVQPPARPLQVHNVRKPSVPPSPRGQSRGQLSSRTGYARPMDVPMGDVPMDAPMGVPLVTSQKLSQFGSMDSTQDTFRSTAREEAYEDRLFSTHQTLPTLVPMPPPKFTSRDPMTFSPPIVLSRPASLKGTPRTR